MSAGSQRFEWQKKAVEYKQVRLKDIVPPERIERVVECTLPLLDRTRQNKLAVQGGGFRLDLGPTEVELATFQLAIALFSGRGDMRKRRSLVILLNDIGLKSEERPKTDMGLTPTDLIPLQYIELLEKSGIKPEWVLFFYESTLRNGASSKMRSAREDGYAIFPGGGEGRVVATCPYLMGQFYQTLERRGFTIQVGFNPFEPKPVGDNSCMLGAVKGTSPALFGKSLGIKVLSYSVYPNGTVNVAGAYGLSSVNINFSTF